MNYIRRTLPIDTMGERYVNPYTDFGFKLLFGTEVNKDLLISFLNALLNKDKAPAEQMEILDVKYLPQEKLGRSPHDRRAIFDIYCITTDGKRFLVEMQNAYQDHFRERSIYYSSFPIQDSAQPGKWDFEMKDIYTIGVLNFVFHDDEADDECYHEVKLKDTRTNEVFYDKLTYIYLEMPKFKKRLDELETLYDKWLFVLGNMTMLFDRPAELQERVFKKIFRVAEIAMFDEAQRFEYNENVKVMRDNINTMNTALRKMREQSLQEGLQKGLEEGREKGLQEGREKGMADTVRKLLAANMNSEQIALALGMTAEELEQLLGKNENPT